ncbi:MAG TPA: chitobiase/beta-hexosaminidase C-terminal domain-containing protein, partial [Kribbella sp.]
MIRSPQRSGRRRSRWLAALVALVLAAPSIVSGAGVAVAAGDYTQSATSLNATQAQISFTPTTPAVYVDVHYLVNGQGQQNFRMDLSAGTWRKTVSGLSTGNVIDYWFTYEKSGPQYDTPHFSYTHGDATTTVATPDFSPAAGVYASAQTVTISTSTAGSTIRYTLDGSTPTASSPLYSGPISVPSTRTVNAIGIKSGLANSAVARAAYTIGTTQAGCPTQPDVPNFGPNTRIFDPGMSAAGIQSQLDADFAAQKDTLTAQMADRRVAHLFKPGAYSVHDDVGYYTSVAGLGQNPGDVVIDGAITVDAFN